MQTDPSLSKEQTPAAQEQASAPTPSPKKAGFNVQVLFLVILVLAAAGLGYWAMQQNNALTAATQDLGALQAKYDALTSEKNSLSSELDQVTKEIETTRQETTATNDSITTTKADLSKANTDTNALKKKMEKAKTYMDVFRYIYEDDTTGFIAALIVTGDDELLTLIANWTNNPTFDTWVPWAEYALETAIDILK